MGSAELRLPPLVHQRTSEAENSPEGTRQLLAQVVGFLLDRPLYRIVVRPHRTFLVRRAVLHALGSRTCSRLEVRDLSCGAPVCGDPSRRRIYHHSFVNAGRWIPRVRRWLFLPSLRVELCPRRRSESSARRIIAELMRIVVAEPHCGYEVRRVSDEPDVSTVVGRARFSGNHPARTPVANGTSGSVIDYRTQHRCQLVCVTRVDDTRQRSGLAAPQHVAVACVHSLYEARSYAKSTIREGSIRAHQLDRCDVERAQGDRRIVRNIALNSHSMRILYDRAQSHVLAHSYRCCI